MGNSSSFDWAESDPSYFVEQQEQSSPSKSLSSGAAGTSTDPFLETYGFIRGQALDASRLATISWEDFLRYISALNEKCRNLVDSNGKYLLFAIKKGSHHSYLWKATVRICCLKMNNSTGKVESRKFLTLVQFLRLHSSLTSMLNSYSPSENGESPTDSSETPVKRRLSAGDVTSSHLHADASQTSNQSCSVSLKSLKDAKCLGASILLERIDDDLSDVASDLESNCVICMERKPDVLLPCTHCYCLPCIEQWNMDHRWCPICRTGMETTDEAWVISDYPEQDDFTDYLLTLAEEPK